MARLLSPIFKISHSPTNLSFSGTKNDSFGNCKVSVMSACTMLSASNRLFLSPCSPEGISIATLFAWQLFMHRIVWAKTPSAGLLSPLPKIPSTMMHFSGSVGCASSLLIMCGLMLLLFNLSRFFSQSGDSLSLGFISHTSTFSSEASSIRATASASPPLLPGPAKMAKKCPCPPNFSIITSVRVRAARSIRSNDEIGS